MSIPQTAVTTAPVPGVPGQLVDLHSGSDAKKVSGTSEEATKSIPMGRMVKRGSGDDLVALCSSQADVLEGISLFGHAYGRTRGQAIGQLDSNGFTPGTTFEVLKEGEVWVEPTSTVDPTDEVHVQVVAETGTGTTDNPQYPVGSFRSDASADKTLDISAFARWRSTTSAANLPAKLWINMAMFALATADT